MINVTHVPPDKYMIGNRASSFPGFSPESLEQEGEFGYVKIHSINTNNRVNGDDREFSWIWFD